ncbi:MAG: class I SAM-dependent methyltransferase [Hyphomicrobium sp.]
MAKAAENRPEPVADTSALEIFQNQWDVYRKFLQHDYLSNAAACSVLHRFLNEDLARPFRILDLACGDSSGIVTALEATPIESYRGVDLSAPALALAARNLAVLTCPVELDEADFTGALLDRGGAEDIVWISLSLHHLATADKLSFMRDVRASLAADAAFLIYEPTCRDGEDRAQYLERFEEIGRRDWTRLTDGEFAEAMKHVRTCDLPETVSDWHSLGREAGFAASTCLYTSPTDLFRLFLYTP